MSKNEEERAIELHRRSIVIDAHMGEPSGLVYTDEMIKRIKEMLDSGEYYSKIMRDHWEMSRDAVTNNPEVRNEYADVWKRSGVTCVCGATGVFTWDGILKGISRYNFKFHKWRELLVQATSACDIRRAKKDGKHAVMWDVEDTMAIGFDLGKLDFLYDMGVRIITLTYNRRNFVGDGCTEPYNSGLSDFGFMVVDKLNKLGIVIDTAHSGSQTTIDATDASRDPIIATHTGCQAVYDHDRCKTDEEIKAIAEKGGVIGIFTVPYFVGEKGTIGEVLDHIDHVVKIVGIDHVGIGTDYGGLPEKLLPLLDQIIEAKMKGYVGVDQPHPEYGMVWVMGFKLKHFRKQVRLVGMEDWSRWPNITRGLVSRGYSDQEIKKILGENMLRVFDKVIK